MNNFWSIKNHGWWNNGPIFIKKNNNNNTNYHRTLPFEVGFVDFVVMMIEKDWLGGIAKGKNYLLVLNIIGNISYVRNVLLNKSLV